MSTNKKKLVIITGPTGVGKTNLALKLAKKINCDIFSADSRQIYKELEIGVAKPTKEELHQVKHHFINHVSIKDHYDVGMFENQLIQRLNDYYKTKDIAILTGGTGFYIRAITDGLDQFPDISIEIKDHYNAVFENDGLKAIQQELLERDPKYYQRVDLSNHRRVLRALEVIRQSGKPYSEFIAKNKTIRNFKSIGYLILRDRQNLYDRINQRVDLMVDQGLIEEAQTFFPLRGLKALETVGYSELFDFFEGKTSKQEAIKMIKQNSRRYAKRQLTWFRKYGQWTTLNYD